MRKKRPDSLYSLAQLKSRQWIMRIAYEFYITYGDYNNVNCQKAVLHFNKFLTSYIPAQVIDELCSSLYIKFDYETEAIYPELSFDRLESFDQRIILSMYIHSNMKTLNTYRIINDLFWKTALLSLKNLSRLDLNKVCTDEILEVVGSHCVKLKFVNITSKSSHTRQKYRHNALKLQFCVSDVGLNHLSKCKELREIVMNSLIRKGCGGRQITNEGIKTLLLCLPKLRRINYSDTGTLFDSINESCNKLSLISITDYHPFPERIPKIERMCPYLQELQLTYANSSDEFRSDIVLALSNSELKLSNLGLANFPFDEFLARYLKTKGKFLKMFTFIPSFIESSYEFFLLLGQTCTKLEYIQMMFQTYERGYSNNNDFVVNSTYSDKEKQFSNLQTLIMKGLHWDVHRVLPLVLKHAVNIRNITLNNHGYLGCLDNLLNNIQQTNHFLQLQSVSFFKGASVSLLFLQTFLQSCPLLNNIVIESESDDYVQTLLRFRNKLLCQNFDVIIEAYTV